MSALVMWPHPQLGWLGTSAMPVWLWFQLGENVAGLAWTFPQYFLISTNIFTSFYLVCVCQLLGLGDLEEDVVCAQGPPVLLICQGVGLLETVCRKISIYFYWNFIALGHAHDDDALLSCKLFTSALSDFVMS